MNKIMTTVQNSYFVRNPNSPTQPNFPTYSRKSLLQSMKPEDWPWNREIPIKSQGNSFKSSLCFPGLVGFVYHCWANELPMELTPTLFHGRLISEFCTLVLKEPEAFRSLFTKNTGKQTLVTLTDKPESLDIDSLIALLKAHIPSQVLLDNVLNVTFSTDTKESTLSKQIALCRMATPYYDYMTTMCGIPSIRFAGTLEDWNKLKSVISVLKELNNSHRNWSEYLVGFEGVVDVIFSIVSNSISTEESCKFVHTIIRYEKNQNCGSGHKENVISGWLLKLYFDIPTYNSDEVFIEKELRDFPTDIHYVPYENFETKRMFFRAIGILDVEKSEDGEGDGFVKAKYLDITEEVLSREYFAILSGKEMAIHEGVSCDICNVSPIIGVRYKCNNCENFDLCETCYENKNHQNKNHTFRTIEKPINFL